ncbi:hypothetical protein SCLCIDRAFT_1206999 [Scleroderma citrinum Foug A]|uniref:Uncharacterized protein n=1 Tax=Scleroderma citrinum Foug A TaxID=1036808 RepID=A0A0C3ESM4_9AGAM|nr:hypothetical protein SCLCIDRAFT_1206999 [Scleroderma citrinum Foug A]
MDENFLTRYQAIATTRTYIAFQYSFPDPGDHPSVLFPAPPRPSQQRGPLNYLFDAFNDLVLCC